MMASEIKKSSGSSSARAPTLTAALSRGEREANLRWLTRFLLTMAAVSIVTLALSTYLEYETKLSDLYTEGLSFLGVLLLGASAIYVIRRVEYIPKVTPAVIIGASAMMLSQFLNFVDEIPGLQEWFQRGHHTIFDARLIENALLYCGAAILLFSCYISILDAAHVRMNLAEEGGERARALDERAKAEVALRESESRYRQLIDLSPISIFVHEGNKILFANRATARMMGADHPSELLGRAVGDFVHPDSRPKVAERMRRLFSEGKESELHEIRILRLDGSVLHAEVSAIPIVYHGQTAAQVVMHDITERRRAEKEKEHLESQVRHAQKMEAIGTLAGGVAHDFNNLLAGILGYSNLLKTGTENGTSVYKAADVIERAAERAAQLTQQLLGFARKGKLQNAPVSPHAIIQEAIALLIRTIDKSIRIKQNLRAGPAKVMGDPTQIQQVIINLALNARDAMPDGGELLLETDLVEIDAQRPRQFGEIDPGHYVVFSVTDTGCGIPKEFQERIFEPFFTTKRTGEGTGMGLAMVYGIVKNHGGTVTLYSEEGHGTTIRVYLPQALKPEPTPLPSEMKTPVRGTGRILIVDDEEVVREMATDMLIALGYQVITACDGKEALEVYRQHKESIDLAVIDMVMPNMGGRECFRGLKKINPEIKAILSTGYSRDGAAQEILNEGMRGFAQKPYRMNQLSEIVASAMN